MVTDIPCSLRLTVWGWTPEIPDGLSVLKALQPSTDIAKVLVVPAPKLACSPDGSDVI